MWKLGQRPRKEITNLDDKNTSVEGVGRGPELRTLQRKSHFYVRTNISRKGIERPQSQPHSRVCEGFIYSYDRSAYSATGKYVVDLSWEYINRSQRHECGNWD
jgi:hypothetical protein